MLTSFETDHKSQIPLRLILGALMNNFPCIPVLSRDLVHGMGTMLRDKANQR